MRIQRLYIIPAAIMAMVNLLFAGCSEQVSPPNIEPVITLLEPSDISRTDATLGVTIKNWEGLSYIRFKFGESGKTGLESGRLTPVAETMTYHLTGLTPSTTYFYMAEGGNDKAIVRTPEMTFTTNPYELPTLSETSTLSTGPAGILIGFDVLSDGGTPVLTAGCDLLELSSGEKTRIFTSVSDQQFRYFRIYVSIPRKDSAYEITPFVTNKTGESRGYPVSFTPRSSITLDQPGLLAEMAESVDFSSGSIVIAGKMNGDDFRFLRSRLGASGMPDETAATQKISVADLSDVEITEGGGPYDGSRFTETDIVTTGLFADCKYLTTLYLPITAKQVMGEAFKNCENLVSVTLPSLMRLFGPSSGCPALEAIVISEGNDLFKSSEGVLFNRDLREILWFPAGKSGTFEIPSSVMAIGENTFRDSSLSTLIFPDGLSSIGRGALSGSRLHEVVLPGGLVNIPEALFQNSGSLHTVYLGSETAYIGAYVFDGCPLTDLYLPAQLPPVADKTAFGNNPADIYSQCVLHVKEGTAPLYRNNSFWKNFKNITTDL